MIQKVTGKAHRTGRQDTVRGAIRKKKTITKTQIPILQASGRGAKNARRVKRHKKPPRPDVSRS